MERGRIDFRASVRSLALVATSQPAIPGWSVEVDGHRVQPVRVDAAFLGVVLAPGEHRVTVRYLPWTFRAGLGLFGVAVLFVVAAGTPWSVPAVKRLPAYFWTKATTFGFTRRSKSE
ncbi:hypothetical protein EG835_02450 [bacterium]|nr:hypothetical protein [bacterium]